MENGNLVAAGAGAFATTVGALSGVLGFILALCLVALVIHVVKKPFTEEAKEARRIKKEEKKYERDHATS